MHNKNYFDCYAWKITQPTIINISVEKILAKPAVNDVYRGQKWSQGNMTATASAWADKHNVSWSWHRDLLDSHRSQTVGSENDMKPNAKTQHINTLKVMQQIKQKSYIVLRCKQDTNNCIYIECHDTRVLWGQLAWSSCQKCHHYGSVAPEH